MRGGFPSPYPAMSTVLVLVESSHPQTTDVTGRVVARGDGVVVDYIRADEADLGVVWDLLSLRCLWPGHGSNILGNGIRGSLVLGAI